MHLLRRLLDRQAPTSHAQRGHRARRTGRRGERAAARALRTAGYRILARNLRTPRGEVDILALDGDVLVVVEVKTREAGGLAPDLRLGGAQIQRLRAAGSWLALRRRGPRRTVRHDLVAVTLDGRRASTRIHRNHF